MYYRLLVISVLIKEVTYSYFHSPISSVADCLVSLSPPHNVLGFTVQVSTIDPSNDEGKNLTINVRLDGQIFGAVDIELELLTVSEFEGRNIGPLPVAASGKNHAERKWHSWMIGKLLCPHSPHSLRITQLNVIICIYILNRC